MVADFALSALSSGLSSLFTGNNALELTTQLQKDLMNHQALVNYKYSQKDLKTKYLANREGLIKANYNPMLALAGVNSNSSWTSPQSVSDANLGATFNGGMANGVEQQNALTSRNAQQSQSALDNANTVKAQNESDLIQQKITSEELQQVEQSIRNSNLDNDMKSQIADRLNNIEYKNTMARISKINADTERMNAVTNSYSARTQRMLANKQIELLKKQGILTDTQAKMLGQQIKWLPADKIMNYINDTIRSITNIGIGVGVIQNGKESNQIKRDMMFQKEPQYQNTNIGF